MRRFAILLLLITTLGAAGCATTVEKAVGGSYLTMADKYAEKRCLEKLGLHRFWGFFGAAAWDLCVMKEEDRYNNATPDRRKTLLKLNGLSQQS